MKDLIFKYYCSLTCCNWYVSTFPTRAVVEKFGISQYKAKKYIKELVDDGLLEKNSEWVTYDEEEPPVFQRGYKLTKKACETEVYKKECQRVEDSLREWANGYEA